MENLSQLQKSKNSFSNILINSCNKELIKNVFGNYNWININNEYSAIYINNNKQKIDQSIYRSIIVPSYLDEDKNDINVSLKNYYFVEEDLNQNTLDSEVSKEDNFENKKESNSFKFANKDDENWEQT